MFDREKNKSTYLNDSRCLTGRSLVYHTGPAGKENYDQLQIPPLTVSDVMLSMASSSIFNRMSKTHKNIFFV